MMTIKRNDVLVIGAGHGGCQVVDAIAAREICKCIFANSAIGDLNSLTYAKQEDKLHFEGGSGSGSDREMGKQFAKENMAEIFRRIDSTNATHIYIVAALAGGTGSGSAIEMAQQIGRRYHPNRPEEFKLAQGISELQDRLVHVIGIVPSKYDNIGILGYENALNFLKELTALYNSSSICSYTFIDNGANSDKLELNEQFASDFEEFLSVPENTNGLGKAIDLGDMNKAMSARGMFQFAEFSLTEANPSAVNIHTDTYFPRFTQGCEYLITTSSSNNEEYVQNIRGYFGEARKQVKSGISLSSRSMAFAFGMKFPDLLVEKIKKLYDNLKEIIKKQETAPVKDIDFTVEKIESKSEINISESMFALPTVKESITTAPVKRLSPLEARAAKMAAKMERAKALQGK